VTERDAAKKGFIVNGVIALAELVLIAVIVSLSDAEKAFSYGYGALISLVLSTIFYTIAAHIRLFGSAVFLPVFGGFFLRMIILACALVAGRHFCDLLWCVAGIIPTMLVTIGCEIALFLRVNEFE
jgi:hypothetical protein